MKDRRSWNSMSWRVAQCAFAALLLFSLQTYPKATAEVRMHGTAKDSFLYVQVYSVQGLINEIASNPKLRARYAKLYHLPYDVVLTYFKENLRVINLQHPQLAHNDYCVTSSGRIYLIHKTLPAGSKVFALRNGKPILQWSCGNPLSARLPFLAPSKEATIADVPTLFNGNKARNRAAQQNDLYGHNHHGHGYNLNENTSTNTPPTTTITPVEKTADYTYTYTPPVNYIPTGPSTFFTEHTYFPSGGGGFNYGGWLAGGGTIAGLITVTGNSPSSTPAPAPELSGTGLWTIGGFLLVGLGELTRRRKIAADTKAS